MAIHDAPGRGRKLCKACNKYVGVRSYTCPNCAAPFGSSLRETPSRSELVPVKRTDPEPVLDEVSTPNPEPSIREEVRDKPVAQGSRIGRINYLKTELIRELKISSRTYGQGILDEISKALGQ